MLNRALPQSTAAALLSAGFLILAACSSEEKKPAAEGLTADQTTAVAVQPGVAGGIVVETFTATATVSAVNKSTRKVMLTGSDGSTTTFTAGPEVRNFDQLRVNDQVTATVRQELVVFARRGDESPSAAAAAVAARTPKGAKPGVLAGETVEIVARVWAIDNVARKVDLVFSDGRHQVVTPRPDVDLTRYRVGDSVVIQMTQTLSVLVVGS